MIRRLATMCLLMTCAIGLSSPSVHADDNESTRMSLKDISTFAVFVVGVDDDARALGLTPEIIRTDVELKLRLAGVRVVAPEEDSKVPGHPYLYVRIAVSSTNALVDVGLNQDVFLERNGQRAFGVPTWSSSVILGTATAQRIRDHTKDLVDQFLNAWLAVNPKK